MTILDAAVRGDVPADCPTNRSSVLAENDDLLSSKGGEGGLARCLHPLDACNVQGRGLFFVPIRVFPGRGIISLSFFGGDWSLDNLDWPTRRVARG